MDNNHNNTPSSGHEFSEEEYIKLVSFDGSPEFCTRMERVLRYDYPIEREILRKRADEITDFSNEELSRLLCNLLTVKAYSPISAVTAPQIGISKRAVVMNMKNGSHTLYEFINPVITAKAGLYLSREHCASLRGVTKIIPRYQYVKFSFQNPAGQSCSLTTHGKYAARLQHCIDHLDGRLIIDFKRFKWRDPAEIDQTLGK